MKFNVMMEKFLTNKWVLNAIGIISLLNIIGYMVLGNLNAVIFFIVIGLLTRYFSKNMIIVLGVPLLLVNLMVAQGQIVEGMETATGANKTTKSEKEKEAEKKRILERTKDREHQKATINKINQQDAKSKQGLPITPLDHTTTSNTSNVDESFSMERSKNRGHEIDYAATVEDAYDQLNKILGSDGIKRLTSDTQTLMKQQMQLAESMKSMGPLIQNMAPMLNQAKDILGSMGDSKNGLGDIMNIAQKLSGKQ